MPAQYCMPTWCCVLCPWQEMLIADKARVGDFGFSQTIHAFLVTDSLPIGLRVGSTCDVIGHTRMQQDCTMQAHAPNDASGTQPCLQINSIVTAPAVPAGSETPTASRDNCQPPWLLSPLSPAVASHPTSSPSLGLESIPQLEKVTDSLCRLLCSFGAHANSILPLFCPPSPPLLSLSLLLSIASSSGDWSPTYRGTMRQVLGFPSTGPSLKPSSLPSQSLQTPGSGTSGQKSGRLQPRRSSSSSFWDSMFEGVGTPEATPGTPTSSVFTGHGRDAQEGSGRIGLGRLGRGQGHGHGQGHSGGGKSGGGAGTQGLRGRSKLHVLMIMQEVPSFWVAAVGKAASFAESSATVTLPRLRWASLVGKECGSQLGAARGGAARQGATGGALTADSDAVTVLNIPCQGNMEDTWKSLGEVRASACALGVPNSAVLYTIVQCFTVPLSHCSVKAAGSTLGWPAARATWRTPRRAWAR